MATKRGKPALPLARQPELADEPGWEPLDPPPPAAQAQIRAHLAKHGIEPFELDHHIYFGGPREESQIVTWNASRASYHCALCPGKVFWTGDWTDEMIERSVHFDPGLQTHLTGLTDPAERREMALHVLSGEANRQRLAQLRRVHRKRPGVRAPRPNVEGQRAPVQAWLLERVREHGVIAEAFRQAEQMQRADREAWLELCGRLSVPRETLKDWWYAIDQAERDAAVAAGRAARAAKKSTM